MWSNPHTGEPTDPDVRGNEVSLAISVAGKFGSQLVATFLLLPPVAATNMSRSRAATELLFSGTRAQRSPSNLLVRICDRRQEPFASSIDAAARRTFFRLGQLVKPLTAASTTILLSSSLMLTKMFHPVRYPVLSSSVGFADSSTTSLLRGFVGVPHTIGIRVVIEPSDLVVHSKLFWVPVQFALAVLCVCFSLFALGSICLTQRTRKEPQGIGSN